jgi:hypothetical protein
VLAGAIATVADALIPFRAFRPVRSLALVSASEVAAAEERVPAGALGGSDRLGG